MIRQGVLKITRGVSCRSTLSKQVVRSMSNQTKLQTKTRQLDSTASG